MPSAYERSPRTQAEKLSEREIGDLRVCFDNGDSTRVAAQIVKCSPGIAAKYYSYFRAEGGIKGAAFGKKPEAERQPVKVLDREAAAKHYETRHYKSKFEPS